MGLDCLSLVLCVLSDERSCPQAGTDVLAPKRELVER
jgi:hypothetical protein